MANRQRFGETILQPGRHRQNGTPQSDYVVTAGSLWYIPTMIQKKLGRRIAGLRKAQRLTQAELAKKIGCSVEFISLVERGVNAPSVAGLEKFARGLKVEIADLFTFKPKQ